MRYRHLTITCVVASLAWAATAVEAQASCTIIHKNSSPDTVDAFMQLIGGAGGAALLILAPKGGKVIRGAAVMGITSAAWNAAKSYFGNGNDVQICDLPETPLSRPFGSGLNSPDAPKPWPRLDDQGSGDLGTPLVLPRRIFVGPVGQTEELMQNEQLDAFLRSHGSRLKIGDEFDVHYHEPIAPAWTHGKQ